MGDWVLEPTSDVPGLNRTEPGVYVTEDGSTARVAIVGNAVDEEAVAVDPGTFRSGSHVIHRQGLVMTTTGFSVTEHREIWKSIPLVGRRSFFAPISQPSLPRLGSSSDLARILEVDGVDDFELVDQPVGDMYPIITCSVEGRMLVALSDGLQNSLVHVALHLREPRLARVGPHVALESAFVNEAGDEVGQVAWIQRDVFVNVVHLGGVLKARERAAGIEQQLAAF